MSTFMLPYRLVPVGDAYDRMNECIHSLSEEECIEIVKERWGEEIYKVYPNAGIRALYHISALPNIAKKCGTSESWILTGNEFGTEGGLQYPNKECEDLAAVVKKVSDEDIPIIEDLLDYFAPRFSDFPSIDPLKKSDMRRLIFSERLSAINTFKRLPSKIREETARKYGLDESRRKITVTSIRIKHYAGHLAGKETGIDSRIWAVAEDMELPIGLFFDWTNSEFYTGRKRCDMIVARYAMVLQDYRNIITEVCSWLAEKAKSKEGLK